MPELPEVETTKRGIIKHLKDRTLQKVIIRNNRLRWPIPNKIKRVLPQQAIHRISRRSKYLLFETDIGHLLIHLGMSGRLHVLDNTVKAKKHDHVDFVFSNGQCLRYTDPRRFGCILWTEQDPRQHKLLQALGPEPLSKAFHANYLFKKTRERNIPIKTLLMDSHIVVGIGNIYACESLFYANISPLRICKTLTEAECERLTKACKHILKKAIQAGGTSLKDFISADGKPGYFQRQLAVYGRNNLPCIKCKTAIEKVVIAGRSSFYCQHCQQ